MTTDLSATPLGSLQGIQRRSIGKYRFIGRIGSGGMAEVFLAIQEGPARFRKLIAVKVLRSQFAEVAEGRSMFLDEARLAARLSHPNVVSVIEVGEEDGDLFIAMEYLKGQPLSRILSRSPRAVTDAPAARALLRILSDALAGVHHAHEAQEFDGTPLRLIHRDLTPQNIFVTYDGNVKVLDFGIAKAVSSTNETRAGMIKGKIPFMAPEQLLEKAIDRRVDVYSMGCCLWHMIAGLRPYKGISDFDAIKYIVSRGVPSIRESAPGVPAELERICCKAVAFDARDRYPDAAAFQADLDAYIATLGDVGMRQVGQHVSDLFQEEAARIQHLIEAALSGPTDSASLPAFSLTSPGRYSGWPAEAKTSSVSQRSEFPAAIPVVSKPRRPIQLLAAGAALAGATALTGAAFLLRHPAPSQTPAQQQASASPVPSAPAAPVRLKLSAQPPEARLFLDGASVATNPVDFTLPRDGATHMLRAEAPGYFDRVIDLVLDGDKEVALTLEKVQEKASKPGAVYGAAGTFSPSTPTKARAANTGKSGTIAAQQDLLLPATRKPPRQLDVDNPFEKK